MRVKIKWFFQSLTYVKTSEGEKFSIGTSPITSNLNPSYLHVINVSTDFTLVFFIVQHVDTKYETVSSLWRMLVIIIIATEIYYGVLWITIEKITIKQ